MNRRTLFGRLLAAASAFVVAPAVRVEAAPTQYDIEGSFPDGDPMDLMLRGIGTRYICATCRYRTQAATPTLPLSAVADEIVEHMAVRHAGVEQPTSGVNDTITEARAEGYERGRAVEQAKAESRAMHAALDRMGLFDPITDDFGVRIAT